MDRAQKKGVEWLYGQLPRLVAQDVVSPQEAQKLRAHYGIPGGTSSRSVALTVFSVLGALLVGGGIILLIAHNWEDLGRPARVFLSFLPLVVAQAIGLYVFCRKRDSIAHCESAATAQGLMVGAAIALVSQTYHIHGDFAAFVLTWMLLALPLVYLFESTITAVFYVIGATTWLFSHEPYLMYGDRFTLEQSYYWIWLGLLLPWFIALVRSPGGKTSRAALFGWVVCLSIGSTLWHFLIYERWMYFTYAAFYSFCYALGEWDGREDFSGWKNPFRVIGWLGLLGQVVVCSFVDFWISSDWSALRYGHGDLFALKIYSVALPLIFMAGVLFCILRARHLRQKMDYILFGVPLLILLGLSVRLQPMLFAVITNVYGLIIAVYYMRRALIEERMALMNAGIAFLAALITCRFFETEIGYVPRAIAFIVIGAGFFVANYLMAKRKGAKQIEA